MNAAPYPNGSTLGDAFALLECPPPSLDLATLKAVALREFGLTGAPKLLASERDQNLRIKPADGPGWVIKVSNALEEGSVTDFQAQGLEHIHRHDATLPVPRLCRTRDGRRGAVLEYESIQHSVRALSFLEGIPMREIEPGPPLLAALGDLLARLTFTLEGFSHPAEEHCLLWDLQHFLELRPLLERLPSADRRQQIERHFERFERHVSPVMSQLRTQVVYNDLNPSNVLVDPRDDDTIAGIIDFGDMVKAPIVFDLAIAASYQLRDTDDPLVGAAHLVSAYHRRKPLTQTELTLLPLLMVTRLITTVLITEWRATRHPSNKEYILRNNPAAWRMLYRLETMPNQQMSERLLDPLHP